MKEDEILQIATTVLVMTASMYVLNCKITKVQKNFVGG